jgi:hypothetical protein
LRLYVQRFYTADGGKFCFPIGEDNNIERFWFISYLIGESNLIPLKLVEFPLCGESYPHFGIKGWAFTNIPHANLKPYVALVGIPLEGTAWLASLDGDSRTLVNNESFLSGHVDGAYFGGHVRPANRKADRVDRRLSEHRTDKRRCVVAMRERGGRTLPFVVITEDQAVPFVREMVEHGSTVYADEAASWDALHAFYDARRVNHSIAFHDEGADTNQAGSFFSRLRRAEIGQHHCISRHLHQYVGEMA